MTNDKDIGKKEYWFEKNPRKTIFFFIVFVFLLAIFSVEKYLDVTNNDYLKNQHKKRIQRYIRLREHAPLFDGVVKPDEVFISKTDGSFKDEYQFRIDKDGFIMPSRKHDDPDINIVFLGGSTTECDMNEELNRFPYLAGKLLEDRSGMKVNSFNGGVSGNNSIHSINILLNKVIPMNPDIVVMMHNINDLNILLLTKSYWNKTDTKSPIQVIVEKDSDFRIVVKAIKNIFIPNLYQSIAYGLFDTKRNENEFIKFRGKKIDVDELNAIREFEKNLKTFIEICRVRGITPVLMTMASRFRDSNSIPVDDFLKHVETDYGMNRNDYVRIFEMFNHTILETGRVHNVLVIDLSKLIPNTKDYMVDIVHYNDNGSRFAAEIISKDLKKLVDNIHE